MVAVFAKYLAHSKNWYVEALKKKALEEALATDRWLDDMLSRISYHIESITLLCAFFLWFLFGAVYVGLNFDFTFIDSIFFALSSLSAGGRLAIPDNADDIHYVVVGLYVCTGIPVMNIAMGVIANAVVSSHESAESLRDKMMARITETELELMKIFGIEDGSGDIDAKEFVVLTLVRIGALEPELIKMITELYDNLAEDSSGALTHRSLQQMNITPKQSSLVLREGSKSLINKKLSPRKSDHVENKVSTYEDIV